MHEYEAGIIRTESRGGSIYIVHLSCGEVAREAAPGQFVQVRVGTGTDPFLRRTFSIYGVDRDRGHIRLLIEVVGPGTGQITAARHGDCLNIIGPLGKGFDLDGSRLDSVELDRINRMNKMKNENHVNHVDPVKKNIVLVAGGAGIAPLIFLAETIAAEDAQSDEIDRINKINSMKKQNHVNHVNLVSPNIVFMVGARTAAIQHAFTGLIPHSVKTRGRVSLLEATDDGSLGYHGFVTGLLEEYLASLNKRLQSLAYPDIVFTCGPDPMMKAIAAITARAGIRCQASLEERMACGMGACYGCAVPLKDGRMARSCVEGPVFDAHEVDW